MLVICLFSGLFLIISPWLVKHKFISAYRREKVLVKVKSLPIPTGLWWLIGFFIIAAITYITFYSIHGQVKNITDSDLSQLSIVCSWFDFRADDLRLKYNFNHWWNILFLGLWLSLMRYFIKYRYKWCFPGTTFYFSGYFFIATMIVVMSYFTFVSAPFYGLILCLVVICMYILTILLLFWFGVIESNSKKNF